MEYLTYKQFITRYPDWFKMGTCYQEYLEEYYSYWREALPARHPSEYPLKEY